MLRFIFILPVVLLSLSDQLAAPFLIMPMPTTSRGSLHQDRPDNTCNVDLRLKLADSSIPAVIERKSSAIETTENILARNFSGNEQQNPIRQQQVQQQHQELAHRIATSFEPRTFRPASKLLANRHVQTISGALLREEITCRYVKPADKRFFPWIDPGIEILASCAIKKLQRKPDQILVSSFWHNRERFDTQDNDFFEVDFKYVIDSRSVSTKGTVIVVHGLQSNSNSSVVRELAQAFTSRGLDVAAINFRGCSGTPNNSLKAYHFGFTDDLKQLISVLSDRLKEAATSNGDLTSPPPIFLSGKSLGANVVLKVLGELGEAVHQFNIQGAAVNCCPFDNQRNAKFLLQGFSKVVYNGRLLKSLKCMAFSQLERFHDTPEAKLVDMELLKTCTTITEFDEAFTASLFGFENHLEYYKQTSCLNFMDQIRVPTLIYNARDDPFFDPVFYPWDFHCDSVAGKSRRSPIRVIRSDHGGHLGYMFHNTGDDEVSLDEVSFMPSELARFIDHIHNSTNTPYDFLSRDGTSPNKFSIPSMTFLRSAVQLKNRSLKEQAFKLASNFQPKEFRPPSELSNKHLQTISGVFLRSDRNCRYVIGDFSIQVAIRKGIKMISAMLKEPDVYGSFWERRQRIDTPDGDFFHVDYKYHSDDSDASPSSKGIVVIVHGLQSSSNSSLSVDLGRAFSNQGFDVACVNFRGCSGEPNSSLRAYHLGFTDDLIQLLGMLNSNELKPPPIFLSGFSLGANVVLKALGELGGLAFTDYNIYGAAVSGAPFDNERNIAFVQQAGFNKLAYNDSLLKSLKMTAFRQLERQSQSKEAMTLSIDEIASATTISALESALIAPVFGFRDNVDYYRKTNCVNFLDNIAIPTLIMNAGDDPFFDPSFFPWEKSCESSSRRDDHNPIKMVRTEHGGHLGFMFHQISKEENELQSSDVEVSFMPGELARFVSHVFDGRIFLECDLIRLRLLNG
jgi:uncharacterized protein